MNAPPYLIDMRIQAPEHRFSLWLPLFLLWPLMLVFGVLSLVLTILADITLFLLGQRYHYYTLLLLGIFATTTELRGTTIHIRDNATLVDLTIK